VFLTKISTAVIEKLQMSCTTIYAMSGVFEMWI
jgi:hypothetical protein